MSNDDGISRRKFLGAAAAAATAGCIGEDDSSQTNEEPATQNGTPTGTPSNNTRTQEEQTGSTETNQTQQSSSDKPESEAELELQEALSEEFDMWIEINYNQLNMPDSAVDQTHGVTLSKPSEGEKLYSQEDLVTIIGNNIYKDQEGIWPDDPGDEVNMNSYFLGLSGSETEYFDEQYREVFGSFTFTNDDGEPEINPNTLRTRAFDEEAIEDFLTENVEGVSDYSEDIDEELLEYAQS